MKKLKRSLQLTLVVLTLLAAAMQAGWTGGWLTTENPGNNLLVCTSGGSGNGCGGGPG